MQGERSPAFRGLRLPPKSTFAFEILLIPRLIGATFERSWINDADQTKREYRAAALPRVIAST
jgi:hypothetical protein